MPPQRGLGRGLESLIPTQARPGAAAVQTQTQNVPISRIQAGRFQPRRHFNDEHIAELAESIKQQGLIQPLVVAPAENSSFELIAGERRLRAAKIAGLSEVPVVIKKVTDKEQFQISLIENLQREDLNPMEEAAAFKRLMEEFSLTQEELSHAIGKGRVVIANTLRLLGLPEPLQKAVADGTISAGHARNLVSINDQKLQNEVAQKIQQENLTVRDVEKIVSNWKSAIETGQVSVTQGQDVETRNLQESLQEILGTKVEIKTKGKGKAIKGFIKIDYYSLDDLERLAEILKKK